VKNALLKVALSAGMSPEHAGVPQAHSLPHAPQGRAFAAWEQAKLFSDEVRAGFRSLR
jgi:hypothetical protein